ncbi:MAG TPA: NADH-quinone oxidoreductase subunit H [Candidatus Binatia bacterium]|nr:NADH-quinone oxidoreductase subunit H [Candidatus Binatia bacterium]
MNPEGLGGPVLAILFAPLFLGLIQRAKAFFAGRTGPPLLQLYYDLGKLLRKSAVFSRTTTWVFGLGPVAGVAAVLAALTLLPQGGLPALFAFPGDFVLLLYLLGTARFLTMAAALDTGSSFEGMGASREAAFSALAEPVLLLCLAAAARVSGRTSLSGIVGGLTEADWQRGAPVLVLVGAAVLAVLLAENARIPVDDPSTHLELTMIHEAMVLDHGGPDLAMILWGAALKLWVMGALLVGLLLPVRTGILALDGGAFLLAMAVLAIVIGIVESTIARLRMNRVPQFLVGAGAFAVVAIALILR